jgi:hypothetical protein
MAYRRATSGLVVAGRGAGFMTRRADARDAAELVRGVLRLAVERAAGFAVAYNAESGDRGGVVMGVDMDASPS